MVVVLVGRGISPPKRSLYDRSRWAKMIELSNIFVVLGTITFSEDNITTMKRWFSHVPTYNLHEYNRGIWIWKPAKKELAWALGRDIVGHRRWDVCTQFLRRRVNTKIEGNLAGNGGCSVGLLEFCSGTKLNFANEKVNREKSLLVCCSVRF